MIARALHRSIHVTAALALFVAQTSSLSFAGEALSLIHI
jgi:hypothetical protein